MTPLFYKSLTSAVIITIVFLAINHLDVYLEENHDITGYQKNFLKAPVQFLLIFGVSMTVMHLFSQWFRVKQWICFHDANQLDMMCMCATNEGRFAFNQRAILLWRTTTCAILSSYLWYTSSYLSGMFSSNDFMMFSTSWTNLSLGQWTDAIAEWMPDNLWWYFNIFSIKWSW